MLKKTLILFFPVLLLGSPVVATEKFAIIFGSNYQGASPVSDLELAEADATLMKEKIVKTGNFAAKNVKVFLGEKVTRKNLKDTLDWLADEVKEGDQVFFYFAGHGTFVRDSEAKNGMRNTIVMFDRPHVSDDELNEWLKKIRTKKAVLIFDCCFSGGIAKKGAKVRGSENIPIPQGSDSVVLQDVGDVYFQDKVVIASADDNETAIEMGPPVNHGVFTYYFAEALTKGDLNNDKNITAYEAFYKARNDTVKLAERAKHKQVPQISGNASGFFFVGEPEKPVTTTTTTTTTTTILPPDVKIPTTNTNNTTTTAVVDVTEPVNPQNSRTGTLILDTTYRYDLTGGQGPRVYIADKEIRGSVEWEKSEHWGQTARITFRDIPSGVHNITLRSSSYPDRVISTGVEAGGTTVERIVACKKGRGGIEGHVWVENFTQPFANLQIFLSPIRIPKQPRVRSRADGSFAFQELLPGTYKVFVVGGLGFFTKPYDATVTVDADRVTKMEIVLKETIKKNKK